MTTYDIGLYFKVFIKNVSKTLDFSDSGGYYFQLFLCLFGYNTMYYMLCTDSYGYLLPNIYHELVLIL